MSLAHFLQEREDNREDLGFLIHERERDSESLGVQQGWVRGFDFRYSSVERHVEPPDSPKITHLQPS
jgi:hypothetical protein